MVTVFDLLLRLCWTGYLFGGLDFKGWLSYSLCVLQRVEKCRRAGTVGIRGWSALLQDLISRF